VTSVFIWSGIAFMMVGVLCALLLHPPPAGFSVPKAATKLARERDVRPGQMLRSRTFYVIWLMIFVNGAAGLALFSNAVPIYARVAGVSGAVAVVVFGWLSAANGVGRFLWGWLSDDIGRRLSLAGCFVLQAVGMVWIAHAHSAVAAGVAFALVLLCFGGIFGVTPAVMADLFGTRYFGEDYSFIITAAGAAGIIGRLLVAWLADASGSLTAWLSPLAVVLLVSAVLPFLAQSPKPALATPDVQKPS
jgi:OFA family oxalate/formate antiporter-like MFS transporter